MGKYRTYLLIFWGYVNILLFIIIKMFFIGTGHLIITENDNDMTYDTVSMMFPQLGKP
jgi:hypothetical protein